LEEYSVRTVAVRAATQLTEEGFELSPGQSMHFVYVPGPEKVRAWELIDDPIPYDRQIYTDLFLRAIESLLAPVDVDRHMLDTWMIGNAGYWGPRRGQWRAAAGADALSPATPALRDVTEADTDSAGGAKLCRR
jgi:hypothetical protein